MDNIIIRKAKMDHVCECCGHIIHKGEEYLDKIHVKDSKTVKHYRYHDICPSLGVSKYEKLAVFLTRNGPLMCADRFGKKATAIGISVVYDAEDESKFHYLVRLCDWGESDSYCINADDFLSDYHDANGDFIIEVVNKL